MSYLIQNFSYPYYTPRTNVRLRALFLIRNVATLYVFFGNPTRAFNLHAFSTQSVFPLPILRAAAFGAIARVTLSKVKKLKYTPIGCNFAITAHFNTLAALDNMLSKLPQEIKLCNGVRSAVEYPYSTGVPIVHTPVANRPFSYALYKFLYMSLNLWFAWPGHYRISTHYSNVRSH